MEIPKKASITGVQVAYYVVCRRKLWLFTHQISMEQTSEKVKLGKLLHETSYKRKTKEIGIMKSIGATNFDVLSIFLIESGLMGLVGGFFGVILGTLISLGIGKLSTDAGFKLLVKVNPELMIFGLLFAFFVGMISGSLPARQAAKLKSVDALRHE